MYRHALRVTEAVTMRLDQLNLKQARIWVKRSKNSLDTEQAVEGDELRAIKRYLTMRADHLPWLFVSERGQPMTRQAVNYLIREAGERAGLGRPGPTCCATAPAMRSVTRAMTSAYCKTSWATAIRGIRPDTPGLPADGLRDYGSSWRSCARLLPAVAQMARQPDANVHLHSRRRPHPGVVWSLR